MGANTKLGLPVDKMRKVVIAFDIDGTLRSNTDGMPEALIVANERIRDLLIILASFKNTKIIVWSGSGELYARQVGAALGIHHYVDQYATKTDHEVINADIVVDDIQDTAIGKINLICREK